MTEEKICRVLIVDNELEYAAQTASKLEAIRPSLLNNNQLQIRLTNNAYFVVARLRQSPSGQPPWDIIIADVYMPFPSCTSPGNGAETNLLLSEFRHRERSWPCWQSTYGDVAAGEEKVDHGGLRIAMAMSECLSAGQSISDLKLILMSECLFGEERERLLAYQTMKSQWLKYYDKADWERNLSN